MQVFWGGGDVHIISKDGVMVIGGTVLDDEEEEEVTPLKTGDVATTATIENKLATSSLSHEQTEKQLFANMFVSATQAVVSGLINGGLTSSSIERVVAYGTIMKPGTNLVSLYKLIAPFNGVTYVQVDYRIKTIYWHYFFNRVLQYTFNKLGATSVTP